MIKITHYRSITFFYCSCFVWTYSTCFSIRKLFCICWSVWCSWRFWWGILCRSVVICCVFCWCFALHHLLRTVFRIKICPYRRRYRSFLISRIGHRIVVIKILCSHSILAYQFIPLILYNPWLILPPSLIL